MTVITIQGTTGNDTLTAPAGDIAGAQYWYSGGATPNAGNAPNGGSDNITTGGGNDTVFIGLNNGHDVVTLGSGTDSVIGAGEIPGALAGGAQDTLNAGGGNDTIDIQTGGKDLVNGSTITGANMYAYMHGDTIGQDTVNVYTGQNNVVLGSQGNDSIIVTGNASGIFDGQEGNNTIDAHTNSGDLVIYGGTGNASILGGSLADQIVLYNGNNTVTTGAGHDTLNVGTGHNNINLGTGSNVVYLTGGHDTIGVGTGSETFSYSFAPGNLNINMATGVSSVDTFNNLSANSIVNVQVHNGDTLIGGLGNETLIGTGGNNLIENGQLVTPVAPTDAMYNITGSYPQGTLSTTGYSIADSVSSGSSGQTVTFAPFTGGARFGNEINYVSGIGSEKFVVNFGTTQVGSAVVNIGELYKGAYGVASNIEIGAFSALDSSGNVVASGTFSGIAPWNGNLLTDPGNYTLNISAPTGKSFSSLVFTAVNDGGEYLSNGALNYVTGVDGLNPDNSDYFVSSINYTPATLSGGSNDLLQSTGSGNDTLLAGIGNNTLQGSTSGTTTFIFNAPSNGNDVIANWHTGDHIQLPTAVQSSVLGLTTGSGNNSIITFSTGNTITVTGDNHLTISDFVFA